MLDPTNAVFHLDVGGSGNSSARIHIGDPSTSSNDVTMLGDVGIGTATPSNKLTVNGAADFTGNVGIGTTTPGEKLDVQGEIRYGTSAEFYPAAVDRKTVIVAGKITEAGDIDTSGTTSDAIASAVRDNAGDYTITFVNGTFATTPVVTVTLFRNAKGHDNRLATITVLTTTLLHIKINSIGGADDNMPFNFIAIGER